MHWKTEKPVCPHGCQVDLQAMRQAARRNERVAVVGASDKTAILHPIGIMRITHVEGRAEVDDQTHETGRHFAPHDGAARFPIALIFDYVTGERGRRRNAYGLPAARVRVVSVDLNVAVEWQRLHWCRVSVSVVRSEQ